MRRQSALSNSQNSDIPHPNKINYIFIIPDGLNISGLYTWGLNFRKITSTCKLLFLNQDSPLPSQLDERDCRRLHSFDSHDTGKVADALENFAKDFSPEAVIILPSVGDTSYGASFKLMQRWKPRQMIQPLRVIGTIFGDQENPFDVMAHYESSLSAICGNSSRIATRLKEKFSSRKNDVFLWNAFVPTMPSGVPKTPDSPIRLLFAGRLDESAKKVSRLPKICNALTKLNIPFEMTVAGEGPEEKKLRKSISRLSLRVPSSVKMVGALDPENLKNAFKNHHVFVLVSSTEGLPMAMLEAMAARLCPIAMEVPSGVSEIISHGKNGMLVPQEDFKAFAKCIATLSREPKKLENMRNAARKFVSEKHSAQNFEYQIRKKSERAFDNPPPSCNPRNDYYENQIGKITHSLSGFNGKLGLWGGGMFGRKLVDRLILLGLNVSVIFDKNPKFNGTSYRNIPYAISTKCTSFNLDKIVIGSVDFSDEMKDEIESHFTNTNSKPPSIVFLGGKQ